MSPERQGQVAPQHWWHQQQRPHSRIPLYPKRDRSALGADRSPKPSPEGPGWGEWSWPDAERSPWRRLPPTPGRPAGGGGIELTLSSVSEDSEEEADTLTERAERAGEGDRPLPRFPPKWDLSLPDECLRRFSRREDSLARSHLPGKTVAEAAPAGGTTTGAGTLADKQATWAADVTGAAGPGSTPALVTPATKTPQPHPAVPRTPTGWGAPWRGQGKRTWEEGWSHPQPHGGFHRRPKVAAIPGSNTCLLAILETLSRLPTPSSVTTNG